MPHWPKAPFPGAHQGPTPSSVGGHTDAVSSPVLHGGTRSDQPHPLRGDTPWAAPSSMGATLWAAPSSAGGHAVSPTPAYWAEDFTSHDSAQGKNLGWLFPGPWTHHTEMSPLIACTLSWRRRREIKFWLSHSFINNTVIFITLWIIFSYHFGLTGGGKKKILKSNCIPLTAFGVFICFWLFILSYLEYRKH